MNRPTQLMYSSLLFLCSSPATFSLASPNPLPSAPCPSPVGLPVCPPRCPTTSALLAAAVMSQTDLLDFFSAPVPVQPANAAGSRPSASLTKGAMPAASTVAAGAAATRLASSTAAKKKKSTERDASPSSSSSSSSLSSSSSGSDSESSDDERDAAKPAARRGTHAPAATAAAAPAHPGAPEEETFNFASGLAANEAAAAEEREHAFSSPDNGDQWDELSQRKPAQGASVPSMSASLHIQPDSMLYAASKKLDALSQRMNDAVGNAIVSINRADQRAGVSSRLRHAALPLTDKLDSLSSDMTRKVAELDKSSSRRGSVSKGSRSSSIGDAAAEKASKETSQFASLTSDPNPSPKRRSRAFSSSAAAAAASPAAAESGALDGFDALVATRHKSSSFSYDPRAASSLQAASQRSRGHSGSAEARGLPVPPLMPPPLQPAHSFTGLPGPPAATSSAIADLHVDADDGAVYHGVDTPISNRSSRSNSLSFSQLGLGEVDLGGSNHALQLNSPISPVAGEGLLR